MGKAAKATAKKKIPSAPLAADKGKKKVQKSSLFEKTPKNFRIGGDIRPKRDLTRFVKWPKYIQLQRKKRILLMRLKVPPAINQFNQCIDKNQASQLLKLCKNYQPETQKAKKERLMELAKAKKAGEEIKQKRPNLLKYGLNHVTTLVENREAKLVIIAHNVDPIEMVVWLPALCRKKDVPYCIIKGKERLGQLVHKKKASCVALHHIRKEDQHTVDLLVTNLRAQFNDNAEARKKWGGGIMGVKSQRATAKREAAVQRELAKKAGLALA